MLRGSKNETLEKAFRRHQNPVAGQKNSPKFKAAASATAVPNTIVVVPKLSFFPRSSVVSIPLLLRSCLASAFQESQRLHRKLIHLRFAAIIVLSLSLEMICNGN